MIVVLCIEISLFSALISWRGTPMSERVAEVTILLCEVAAENYSIIQRIRFVRWRREYERSIDRVIRTMHPGV